MLKSIGVSSVYDVKLIDDRPISEYIKEARDKHMDTINIIRNVYSKELRLKYLRDLLIVQHDSINK